MLLTLIRSTMIVQLLVSVVCVEANLEKLPFVPSERGAKVEVKSRRQSDEFAKENSVRDDEDSELVERNHSDRNDRYINEEDISEHRNRIKTAEDRFPRSGDNHLAHKMAKDALKSAKVQATISKLSHVSSSKGTARAAGHGSPVGNAKTKAVDKRRRHNSVKHKRRRKKKRNRHHRRLRKPYSGTSKGGGSSKKTLENKRDISVPPDGTGSTVVDDKSLEKSVTGSGDRIAFGKVDDRDYRDFTTVPDAESSRILAKSQNVEDSAMARENENMIERLMRTTTKDPLKESHGDQGVEYSDYYSDDEVLQDIVANKIPMQLAESKSSNDRFVRQALNSSSSYRDGNRIHGSNRYYRDYDPRRKEFGRSGYPVNYLNDFQNDPAIERLPALKRKSRLTGAEDLSQSYLPNYGPLEYRNEYLDASYPVHVDGISEESRGLGGISELQNNFESSDANKLYSDNQQPVGQMNYLNRYENPLEIEVARDAAEPKASRLRNSNVYQPADFNLYQGENVDASVANQPQIDDARGPNAKENSEIRARFGYPPMQLHGNREQQGEQVSNSFPVQQRYNVPAVNVQNAMEQPLGKVLQSLGIDINEDSAGVNQKANVNERTKGLQPYSAIDRPEEHFISPSYLKKKPQGDANDYYESDNAREPDYRAGEQRNGKNARESHSRRHSIQDKAYNNNNVAQYSYNDTNSNRTMNISMAVHDTKEVASQILDTIMEELEDLRTDPSKNNKREGSWSTAQAGMKLDMRVVNRTIIVTLSDLASLRFHESLLNGTWNVSGHAPFKRGSPFTLIATDNKTNSVAVFVGACRVCQGIDTIAGVWSVARQPKDCRDFQVSTSVFNDIFRKTKLSSLKENQGTNATETTTLKHDKRKS